MTRKHAVQTPGAAPDDKQPTEPTQPDTAATGQEFDFESLSPEEQLAHLKAENAALKDAAAERAARDERLTKADEAKLAEPVERTPGQLRAKDVDPTKIKRAVLTLDGWVCPATSPAPPARQ